MLKRIVSICLVLCLMVTVLPLNARAADGPVSLAPGLSKDEIRQLWEAIPEYTDVYEVQPSTSAPYSIGKLTDEFLANGLATMNLIRRMAGLPQVVLDGELNDLAQHGAVLLGANDDMDHRPPQPDDMPDDFYEKGYTATSSSNLGWGYYDLHDVVLGWMEDDSGCTNTATVGHRRWILNPKLLKVGFGYAENFSVGRIFDTSGADVLYDYIAWPTGNFPREMMTWKLPWSVTLNPDRYTMPNEADVSVTVTSLREGKTVFLDPSNTNTPEQDPDAPFLLVNRDGYGVSNCIIFYPGIEAFDSFYGEFTVDISGIYDRNGAPARIRYTVDFFDLYETDEPDEPDEPDVPGETEHSHLYIFNLTPATCTETGYLICVCDCGDSYIVEETPALGHDWDGGRIVREPSTTEIGLKVYTCNRCGLTDEEILPCVPSEDSDSDIFRISGSNRCETAFAVADMLKAELGVDKFNTIIIANGNDFADALAGSYLAGVKNAPILLHRNGSMASNVEYIRNNLAHNGSVYILGGEAAVPDTFVNAVVDGLLGNMISFTIYRLSGSNRFETNAQILEEARFTGGEILVCNSHNFADALSASAAGKPILLVNNNRDTLLSNQISLLQSASNLSITIVGGPAAVSEALEAALGAYGPVTRIAGSNREGTSVEVAKRYFGNPDQILLAYSRNFPDGLCGGPLAYAMGAPLLLTNARAEAVGAEYVAQKGISAGIVLGGTAALTDDTARKVFGLADNTPIPLQ